MGRIPDEDVQRVRDATDLVGLVSETVVLKRKGRLYWGNCPFHGEKTPSFKIDPGTQLWHCFGCGEGGDAFGFVMRAENLDFPEAIHRLADRAGVEVREEGGQPTGERQRLFAVCEAAADVYQKSLTASKDERSAAARQYLASRGFGLDVARRWSLGYAPGGGTLVSHLGKLGFTQREMTAAGLAVQGDRGQLRDRFYERVMFPIRDMSGRVVGFGGRILGSGEPKYLNSAETPLFHKSKNLYGIERAKAAIVTEGAAVVVEGYTDVIALHEAGITNVVATLGTALTEDHVTLLRRFARRVVYLFDGDAAGVRAALRAAEMVDWRALAESGAVEYAVALIPGGGDPADHVAAHGAEGVREVIGAAVPLLRFVIDERLRDHELKSPEGRAAGLSDASSVLAALGETIMGQDYSNYVADRLLVDYATVRKAVSGAKPERHTTRGDAEAGDARPEAPPAAVPSGPHEVVEREAVRLAAAVPELRAEARELLADSLLASPRWARSLGAVLEEGTKSGAALHAALETKDPEGAALLRAGLVGEEALSLEEGRFRMREVRRRLQEYEVERQIVAKKARMRELDPIKHRTEYDELFTEVASLQREREALRRAGQESDMEDR